jgi:hypothetical protein
MLIREKIWKRTEPPKTGEKDWERRYESLYVEVGGRIFYHPYFLGLASKTRPGNKWIEVNPEMDSSFIYCGTEESALANVLLANSKVTLRKESGDFSVHRSMAQEKSCLPSEDEGWKIFCYVRGDGTRPGPSFYVATKTMTGEEAFKYLSTLPLEEALKYEGIYPPYDDRGNCLLNIPR